MCVCVFLHWAWTLKQMIDDMFCVEREGLEHMSVYVVLSKKLLSIGVLCCVEQETLEHMNVYVVLSEELSNT